MYGRSDYPVGVFCSTLMGGADSPLWCVLSSGGVYIDTPLVYEKR